MVGSMTCHFEMVSFQAIFVKFLGGIAFLLEIGTQQSEKTMSTQDECQHILPLAVVAWGEHHEKSQFQ